MQQQAQQQPTPEQIQMAVQQQAAQLKLKEQEAIRQAKVICLDIASKTRKETDTPATVLEYAQTYFKWITE